MATDNITKNNDYKAMLAEADRAFGQDRVYMWSTYVLPNGHFLNPNNNKELDENDLTYEHSDFEDWLYSKGLPYNLWDYCLKMNVTWPYVALPDKARWTTEQQQALREIINSKESFEYDFEGIADLFGDQYFQFKEPFIIYAPHGDKVFDLAVDSANDIIKAINKYYMTNMFESLAPADYKPKNVGIAYKVFKVKNGKLYPPMVANPGNEDTPVGVWLYADEGEFAGLSKTGRPQVKSTGSGTLAYRPGWHLGDIPLATQFYRTDKKTGEKLFPKDFVWAECEYTRDINYQDEADEQGHMRTDKNGNVYRSDKYQHSLAGLKKLPKDGYYKYRTNPNPDTVPWVITGAIKVKKILNDDEVADILAKQGIEAPKREGGPLKDIRDLGLKEFLGEQLTEAKTDRLNFEKKYGKELSDIYFTLKDKGWLKEAEKLAGTNMTDIYNVMKMFDSPEDLKKLLDDVVDYYNEKNAEKKQAKDGAEVIYKDDNWLILNIKTYEAAKKYGKGTKWCISGNYPSARGINYFDTYIDQGVQKFIFFINKDNHKWCLVKYDSGKEEIWNELDIVVDYIPNLPSNIPVKFKNNTKSGTEPLSRSTYRDLKAFIVDEVNGEVETDYDISKNLYIDVEDINAIDDVLDILKHRLKSTNLQKFYNQYNEMIRDYVFNNTEQSYDEVDKTELFNEAFKIYKKALQENYMTYFSKLPDYFYSEAGKTAFSNVPKEEYANFVDEVMNTFFEASETNVLYYATQLSTKYEHKNKPTEEKLEETLTNEDIWYRGYNGEYEPLDSDPNSGQLYTWLTLDKEYAEEYAKSFKNGKVARVKVLVDYNDIGSDLSLPESVDVYNPGDEDFQEYILNGGSYGYFFDVDDYYECLCIAKNKCKVIDEYEVTDGQKKLTKSSKNNIDEGLDGNYNELKDGLVELPDYLYHATSRKAWEQILKQGKLDIKSRYNRQFPNNEVTYLATNRDTAVEYYYRCTYKGFDDGLVVLKIPVSILDLNNLYIDNNEEFFYDEDGKLDVYSFIYKGVIDISNYKDKGIEVIDNLFESTSPGSKYYDYMAKKNIFPSELGESLDTNNIISLLSNTFGTTDKPQPTAMYILPNGRFLFTTPLEPSDDCDYEIDEHRNIDDFLYHKDIIEDDRYLEDDGSLFTENVLNCIRFNITDEYYGNYSYIQLNKKQPTSQQYDSLLKIFDYVINKGYKYISIIFDTQYGKQIRIELNNYTSDELLKKIKRFYVSGILTENKRK